MGYHQPSPRIVLRFVVATLKSCWGLLPDWILSTWTFQKLGALIHRAHVKWQGRYQTNHTWFLRNVPLLELLQSIVLELPANATWRVFSIGCSSGAELYSALSYVRSARPDINVEATGVDVGEDIVAKARAATYALNDEEVSNLSDDALKALFDPIDGKVRIKEWIRKDTRWIVADALDSKLSAKLGPADLLLANNFIGAMPDEIAERCMENLLSLVSLGGYFVFNGELDLKTNFVVRHGLVPLSDGIEAIHFGDTGRLGWPWSYWSSEPIDKKRPDWQMRYGVVFRKQDSPAVSPPVQPLALQDAEATPPSKVSRVR